MQTIYVRNIENYNLGNGYLEINIGYPREKNLREYRFSQQKSHLIYGTS